MAKTDQAAPDSLGSIAGAVVDQDGQPLAGMAVKLYSANSDSLAQITTAATGTYQFKSLLTGVYRIQARDPNSLFATQYYTATEHFDRATDIIVNGNQVTGIDLTLQPGGKIAGKVTLEGEIPPTQPYANGSATLFTRRANRWQALASTLLVTQTGTYSFSALLPLVYRVCATGYLSGRNFAIMNCYGGVEPSSAQNVTVTSGMTTAAINIELAAEQFEGIIKGKVESNNQPLPGMKVQLLTSGYGSELSVYTYTNASGHYEFLGLPAGLYNLIYSDPKESYAAIWHNQQPARDFSFDNSSVEPLSLSAGQVLSNVNVSMVQYGKVQGNLYLGTGVAVISKTIEVRISRIPSKSTSVDFSRFITTDRLGNYTIDQLFPGTYAFSFIYCTFTRFGENCIVRPYKPQLNEFLQFVPTELTIASNVTVTGINLMVGPDAQIFMSVIRAETLSP